jgi:ABC-type nitrate/sulfonate/bicarbonate transport system permease component
VWQLVAVEAHDLPYAPPPSTIVVAAWHNLGTLAGSIPVSLGRLAIGWGIAVAFGVAFGLLLGMLTRTGEVVEPVGAFIRAVPPVLLMPVLVIWTHLGPALEITTIALGCAWPILVQTIEGVRSVEPVLIDTSRAYRTGRFRHMWTVVAPAAAPKIVTGLRVSLGIALILMVIGEMRGGVTSGLGFQLEFTSEQFDYSLTWACFVLLGIFGYLLNKLLLAADHRLLSWRHETLADE